MTSDTVVTATAVTDAAVTATVVTEATALAHMKNRSQARMKIRSFAAIS